MVRDGGGGGGYPRNLPSVGDHVEVDRDMLRDIAKRLQADLDELNGWNNGSLKDLQDNESEWIPENSLGEYNAGRQIASTFTQAYSQIGGTYSQFLGSYQQVITGILQTVNGYQRAEDATAEAANRANIGGQSGGGQTAGGSGGGGGGAW
ncbi:MAG TPA: hypothetical protein VE465_22125 [Streptosporangiaceae bacterium]|jgi:hypothetical protein|nr:hypothetical protein [Streptosporangiaceae bacterium]